MAWAPAPAASRERIRAVAAGLYLRADASVRRFGDSLRPHHDSSECMTELDPAILDGLLEYDSPTICNAIEEMEVRDPIDGYMGWDVRCMYPDLGRHGGICRDRHGSQHRAWLAQEGAMGLRSGTSWSRKSPKPAVLVLKDVGPDRYRSAHCGDVMATISAGVGGDRARDRRRRARLRNRARARLSLLRVRLGARARHPRDRSGGA